MIVLVGASASGKTELAKYLYEHYGYHKCITTTTRPPRSHEKDGVDYHFLTEDVFLKRLGEGLFIESEAYHGHLYGIQKKDADPKGIVIVEPRGANTLVNVLGKQVFVVLVHASETLRLSRMTGRGDALSMAQERIQFDREVFKEDLFLRIDLLLENEDQSLETLAGMIVQAYQKHKG